MQRRSTQAETIDKATITGCGSRETNCIRDVEIVSCFVNDSQRVLLVLYSRQGIPSAEGGVADRRALVGGGKSAPSTRVNDLVVAFKTSEYVRRVMYTRVLLAGRCIFC